MSSAPVTSRRLRVLQCITRLGLGGAERVSFNLMAALRAEIDFAVFTVHGAIGDEVGEGMRYELEASGTPWFIGTCVPMKRGGMIPGAISLARAVREFRPDIIHFHAETAEACGATMVMLFAKEGRCPMIRTIHNSVFWRFWPRVGRWCDRLLSRAYVACVSEAACEEFLRYRTDSGVGALPAPPEVIYNGVAISPREAHRSPHRANVRRILFAGRFEPQKGLDVLCHALPKVRLEPEVTGEITFMGHGRQELEVRALAAQPPAGWSVTVRPPAADLTEIFPQFDLVVMPSRFEGLGLIAVEATLCGLPMVATDAPGLREALPSNYPWLARPDDTDTLTRAISKALSESSRWADVVNGAQQFALARFGPAAMARGYQRLYSTAAKVDLTFVP
ncbi:MAG: glycosyltransferase family 4 protein [Opitutae bacterium]|nr:glycosyltransferase family 4 protein [Opitutae bacterium]